MYKDSNEIQLALCKTATTKETVYQVVSLSYLEVRTIDKSPQVTDGNLFASMPISITTHET